MGMLIVQHRVKDYRKWRRVYDAHAPMRRKAGLGSGQVYRGADNPDQIAIVFKTKDSDKAKDFVKSDDLRKAMKAAGVIGKPMITLIVDEPPPPQAGTSRVGGRRRLPERPPEASADTWRRYQQALAAFQIGSPKSARTKRL
jgi:hypothetical protein